MCGAWLWAATWQGTCQDFSGSQCEGNHSATGASGGWRSQQTGIAMHSSWLVQTVIRGTSLLLC